MKTVLLKKISKIALVLIPTLTLSMSSTAHDPKFHAKKSVKADCSKMNHNKMDKKDPVAIAMMKKCMKQAKKLMSNMDHSKMGKKMDHSKIDHSKMKKTADKQIKNDDDSNH